jgi:LCP family protein required for cell wall assembly
MSIGSDAPDEAPESGTTEGRRTRRRHRKPRRHWIKRRWLRRSIIALTTIVVLLGAVAVSGYAYLVHEFNKRHVVVVHHLAPVVTTGPHANAQTILLIGSTSRCVLNGKQAKDFGTCASTGPAGAVTNVTGVNSDVIMLLHTDPNAHRVSILSIPRDLVLYNVENENFHKVDAALASDPSQLVNVIEQDFGIPINHYVELNFDTFQNVVNTLGGVKVYFPDRLYDTMSGLNITTPGCHLLNGFQALALVRARHMSYWVNGVEEYDGTGDLGRIVRDHEFLRILAASVAAKGLGNLSVDNDLLSEILPDLTVDSTFTLGSMASLVLDYHSINPMKAPETTMPNAELHTDYMYEGYDYGSVVFPSYPQDQNTIDQWLGLSTPPAANVAPGSFTLAVDDGTGNPSATTATATKLGALGFHVVSSSATWPPVGPLSETVVEYQPGHLADAQRVAQSLSGIVSMAQAPTKVIPGSDLPVSAANVTVLTGSNFSVVSPHLAGSGSGAPSGSGSASGTPASSSSGSSGSVLGPVSASADPAPAYDPKPCH